MSDVAELIRDAYGAYNRGDVDAALELMHPDVEWVPPPSSLEPQPLRGRDAVRRYLAPNIFESQTAEPLALIEEGNRVLVVARVRARGRGSGIELDRTAYHVLLLRDGRAVRFAVYTERDQALAALRGS
jgi:ketosteroid isomerase-like protein